MKITLPAWMVLRRDGGKRLPFARSRVIAGPLLAVVELDFRAKRGDVPAPHVDAEAMARDISLILSWRTARRDVS